MSENWKSYSWGDLATLEYGKGLRDYRSNQGKYRVYGTNGAIGWHSEALCKHAGIVIGRKGAYRGVHYSKEPFYVIDTAFYLKPKQNLEIDLKWAYYELLTKDINGMDSGSAIPSTTRDSFYQLPVNFPPIEEQRRIAEILSALDEKIELNLEMNRTLERIAQATFKHWFVDFQFPGFDGELVDGLPKGWKKVRLEGLVDTISATHKFPNDKIIFLNTSDISEGQVLRSDYSDVRTLPGQAKKSIKKDDILYSEIRPINKRFAYVDFDADDYVVSTKLMVLRAKSSVDSIVLYYFLKSEDVIRELQMLAESRSGTFPQITFFHIKNLEMIVPDDKILELYTSILKSNFEKINSNLRLNKTLTQIRNGLLPKLMSGKIRVAE